MMRLLYLSALAVGLVAAPAARADYYTMSLGNTLYGEVSFDGAGNFGFDTGGSSSPYSFQIGAAHFNDPTNPLIKTAVGLLGEITGTFTIGTISSDSLGGEYASVTTSSGAQFIINDGSGNNLTADLTFSSIRTDGTSTTLNQTTGTVNLTNFAYSGTNQNLIDLASQHPDGGNLTISFTFEPAIPLDQLATNADSTGFSGTLVAAPAPASCLLMLTGGLLSGLGFLRRRIFRLA